MISFVTGNQGKADEIARQTSLPIQAIALDIPEIQSMEIRDVLEAKAREAYRQLQMPVLIDDAGVSIEGLGGLPGALIKWFMKALDNEGICRFADQSPTRNATASVGIGYFDGKEFVAFVEEVRGTISEHPAGTGGYGWDAIFIQEGYNVTRATLTPVDYDRASIRKPALDSLAAYLKSKA